MKLNQSKMDTEANTNNVNANGFPVRPSVMGRAFDRAKEINVPLSQMRFFNLEDLMEKLALSAGKKSFLVFKSNKYMNVLTENIALFYIKYESTVIMCFDGQEYFLNQSLEQIQNSLPEKQFFRLNRQYLINFNAIKEVEHYFARKLLVNVTVKLKEKLLVPREKAVGFLHWLDNR